MNPGQVVGRSSSQYPMNNRVSNSHGSFVLSYQKSDCLIFFTIFNGVDFFGFKNQNMSRASELVACCRQGKKVVVRSLPVFQLDVLEIAPKLHNVHYGRIHWLAREIVVGSQPIECWSGAPFQAKFDNLISEKRCSHRIRTNIGISWKTIVGNRLSCQWSIVKEYSFPRFLEKSNMAAKATCCSCLSFMPEVSNIYFLWHNSYDTVRAMRVSERVTNAKNLELCLCIISSSV